MQISFKNKSLEAFNYFLVKKPGTKYIGNDDIKK